MFFLFHIYLLLNLFLIKTKFNPTILKIFHFEFILFSISFICIFFISLFGHLHDNNLLCKSLLNLNLYEGICGAVIADFKGLRSHPPFIFSYFFEKNYFKTYSIVIIFNFLPILTYFLLQKQTTQIKSTKFSYIIFSLVCFFLLYRFFLLLMIGVDI